MRAPIAEAELLDDRDDAIGHLLDRLVFLFICECKFWEGPAGFTEAIDQLFRYTGWRDTKLAIVMFVREKGLTAILKKAKETLEQHPQFVRWKKAAEETELRAGMTWPGDPARRADLNVFFVHTPEARN